MKKEQVKTDVILKEFWRPNDRFADLFNAVVFNGKHVIEPESLQEVDTDMSGILQAGGYEESLTRARDVVKKTAFGVDFVILGIENQMKVHYAMPLRMMLYDGLGYLKEYRQIAHSRKEERKTMTGDEFLSKMRKEDRLHPIVSIVIYYSEKEWDGPLSLADMMTEMPEEVRTLFPDYQINLVQVRNSEHYTFHNEDVRTVFEISRELFKGDLDSVRAGYKDRELAPDLVSVIGKITESSYLVKQGEQLEGTNMCTALEKLRQEGIEYGIKQKQRELIQKWSGKGFSVSEIAGLLEIEEDEVRKLQSDR